MTRWSETLALPTLLVGDFNIAPLPSDVWGHKQLLKVVSHTPVEVDALDALRASNSWVDLGRYFHPAPARLHTWWSYRSPDWTRNDRGRRLDHMRSEEHTSELQSLMRISYAVFCLKKKKTTTRNTQQ